MNSSSFCKSEIALNIFGPKVPIIKFDCIEQPQAPPSMCSKCIVWLFPMNTYFLWIVKILIEAKLLYLVPVFFSLSFLYFFSLPLLSLSLFSLPISSPLPSPPLPLIGVRITARASKITDLYIAFPDVILQELWYRLLKEAIAGWQKFTGTYTNTCTTHKCIIIIILIAHVHVCLLLRHI